MVRSLLIKKYGIVADEATEITQTFLKAFREYPESLDASLAQWTLSIWEGALGVHFQNIAEDVCRQWIELRYEHLRPDEEVLTMLRCLKSQYFLALITNGPSRSQWQKIARLDLESYFDTILVSGDLCWEKPNKGIFLLACERLNLAPAECMMVGDRLETDIIGAQKAGLACSVYVPLAETHMDDTDVTPDVTIPSVMMLPAILNSTLKRPGLSRYLDLSEPESENSNCSLGS